MKLFALRKISRKSEYEAKNFACSSEVLIFLVLWSMLKTRVNLTSYFFQCKKYAASNWQRPEIPSVEYHAKNENEMILGSPAKECVANKR